MAHKNKVIHSGSAPLDMGEELSENLEYFYIPVDYDFAEDPENYDLFKSRNNNQSVFILESGSLLLQNANWLMLLPSYQIIYDEKSDLSQVAQSILWIKGAFSMDFDSLDEIISFVNGNYGESPEGTKLHNDLLIIGDSFKGEIVRHGQVYVELTGDFGEEYSQLLTWRQTYPLHPKSRYEFYPEIEVLSPQLDLYYKIVIINSANDEIRKVLDVPVEEFKQRMVTFTNDNQGGYINVSLYGKGGEGNIKVGSFHVRTAPIDGSVLNPGGRKFIDPENRNGELFYYFNPGDLKPPLAVYFSGYRSAEGFEGRWMMGAMDCPFLLFGDPRLEGGSFYLGSKELEQQLVDIVMEKITILGFKKSDIILSGMSMGTFGAIYYASDLEPNAVVVSKPLINIGDIALNERLKRPNGWATSLDILYSQTGKAFSETAEQLNEKFWDKFSKGNFENTTFALGYMKNDDYDGTAFPKIFESLKSRYPDSKILYKGLVGRHNDATSPLIQWFLKQYYNILMTNFHRHYEL